MPAKRGSAMFYNNRLKEIRETHNKSQKEIASLLNIAATTLSNYERGTRRPSHEFLMSYLQVFNIPTEQLHNIFYSEHVNDSIDAYGSTKTFMQNYDILEPEKLNELSYSEFLMIKNYAEYIYSNHKKINKKSK
jgi:transcriptional regulator with XRE-family HTH domain